MRHGIKLELAIVFIHGPNPERPMAVQVGLWVDGCSSINAVVTRRSDVELPAKVVFSEPNARWE